MFAAAFTVLLVSAAVATCSLALSKSKVAMPLHALVERRGPQMLLDLLQCPYCLNQWFALGVTLWMGFFDIFSAAIFCLAVIAFATMVVGMVMKLLLMHEAEKAQLRHLLTQANGRIKALEANAPKSL